MIERLGREYPRCRVLVLTMHDDPAYLRAALAAGGSGYVVRRAPEAELLHRDPRRGAEDAPSSAWTSPARGGPAPGRQASGRDTAGRAGEPPEPTRATRCWSCWPRGIPTRRSGIGCYLSVKTIETYPQRIAEKLGLRTRADIIRYAVEMAS